ncbi:hypothetical protein J2I47_14995 [Fibrella sp. HMF5335]|uniref:Uncharacterized protein n=1 Tax=Fibrella rubiginis TaxID=2817060 RepID=A0A939GK12_9BACT|nr:hypothetical protein [Fibrella rubiginis]MBO0937863.1 hypothetical protein [Fibrella rubiginis]
MFGIPANPRFSAGLAQALMPTRNFAQERADKAANLQLVQLDQQQAAQAADQKRTALGQVQNTLSAIDQQSLLAPDKARLNLNLTEPFRQQVEAELRDDYGGDVTRYQRERGDFAAKQFAKQLVSHPLYTRAIQNMANYALAKDAEAKGKLIVGNFDQHYADYMQGRTDTLHFQGAYDAPKNVWDYFDKNHHAQSPYGQYVGKAGGRPQYKAFEVTHQDLEDRLISEGLTPAEAADYIKRLDYRGGRTWKMDSQSPWEAQDQAQQNAFRQQALNYQGQGLAIQREGMSLERHRTSAEVSLKNAQAQKAQAEAKGSTGSAGIVQNIWAPPKTSLSIARGPNGKAITMNGSEVMVSHGVGGEVGRLLAQTVGIESDIAPLLPPDTEGKQAPGLIASNLTSVTVNGQRVGNADESPILFRRVDTNRIFHVKGEGGAPGVGRVPHVLATANIIDQVGKDGRPDKSHDVTVLLPIPYSALAANQIGATSATNNSDEKRAQTVISAPAETGSRSPLSGLIPSRKQQLRAQELRDFLLGPNP